MLLTSETQNLMHNFVIAFAVPTEINILTKNDISVHLYFIYTILRLTG